jgi:hypothetical protein
MRPSKTGRRLVSGVALLTFAAAALPLAPQAKPLKPPSASTGGVAQRTYNSATLNASVNPHGSETSYYFQYGTTAGYGAQTVTTAVGTGTASIPVSQTITGLQTGAGYHYRVVAVSAAGTIAGRDRVFSTRSVALKFELPRTPRVALFGSAITISGALTGTGAAGHELALQASQFPFLSGFATLGAPLASDGEGRFSFRVSGLSQNTQLRVSTLDPAPLRSPVVRVNVAPKVVVHVRATHTAGLVRFYGSVAPALVGTSVAFQLLRGGSGPHTVGAATLVKGNRTSAHFTALVFVKHGLGGRYRAYVRASARYAAGASRSVKVRAAPAAVKAHRRHH